VKIAHPRLLAGSLAVAVIVVAAFAIFAAGRGDGDGDGDGGDVDAQLAPGVVTFPNSDLGNAAVEGDPLPLVQLGDRDGNDVETASFLGAPLVINLWFADCPPCAAELPDFAEVHNELGDDVRFIGINPNDSIERMERFAQERGVSYELYRDDFSEFTNAISAAAFPITLFVSPDGAIIEQTGAIDADELRSSIAQLLEVST